MSEAPRPANVRRVDEFDFANRSCMSWFNHQRLYGHYRDVSPVEFESAFALTPVRNWDRNPSP